MPQRRITLALAALGACTTPRIDAVQGHGEGSPLGDEPVPVLQLPADVRPERYSLDLDITPSLEHVQGAATIEVVLSSPRRVIWLHGRDLRVKEATLEERGEKPVPARYQQVTSEGVARLVLPHAVGPGPAKLRLAWEAPWNTQLVGLYLSRSGPDAYAVTQFEALDARRAFPGFDEPRFKTPFDVTLMARSGDVVVSNSAARSEEALPGGRKRVRFATTRPLPTYLVFFAAGPFDVVEASLPPNEVRRHPLPVRGLAPRGRGRELAFALAAGNEMLVALERWMGIPYPYDKLDHLAASEFIAGAMENAGAILYRDSRLLVDPVRPDEDRMARVAAVMAHEMAHQWFGNLVTLPWWTEAWLNESFAQFLGVRIADAHHPDWGLGMRQIRLVDSVMVDDALTSARAIRQPLRRSEEIWDQFDGLTYQKGMAVLATFERWLGAEPFRQGLRSYIAAHADGTGSTEALLAAWSQSAGRDVSGPFSGFVDRPGVPLVAVETQCGDGARARFTQRRHALRGASAPGGAWEIPVCVRFQAQGPPATRCLLVPPAGAVLELGDGCPAWLMPDAGGVGYYRWALAPPDLDRLRRAGLDRLSGAERLSLAMNVRAAQQVGALPYAAAMDLLAALASDPDDMVAAVGMDAIAFAREHLLGPEDLPALEAAARELYRPALRGQGFDGPPGESEPARRVRVRTLGFLAEVAREPAVRREAARRGRAFAGFSGGPLDPGAVSPDLRALALEVAVEEEGPALYDALLARLDGIADGQQRHQVLDALSRTQNPALDGRAASLWRDERLRPQERLDPVLLPERPAAMRRVFPQIVASLDEMIPLLPAGAEGELPHAASGFCDAAQLAEARRFLGRAVSRHPSMRQGSAKVLERIEACIAERASDRQAAGAWFARWARSSH